MKHNILIFSVASLLSISSHALVINDASEFDIYGSESYVTANDSSTTNIYQGADVSYFYAKDDSSVNIFGGEISYVYGYDNSSVDISGGDISYVKAYNDSTINIYDLDDLSWLFVSDDSIVNIYADNYNYTSGHLSGTWGNGDNFSFWALEEQDLFSGNITSYLPDNIVIQATSVPAPTTFLLFAVSLIALSRRKSL